MRTPIALFLLLGLVSCGNSGPDHSLRAGAAAVDITPTVWPLPLIGNFGFNPADKAADPLNARAIVVANPESALAIVVVDSCYIPREITDQAKERAAKTTPIPVERMLVAATHTHSAPPSQPKSGLRVAFADDLSENEKVYSEQLIQGIADAITQAYEGLEPAEIGWGVEDLPDHVFNRRWFMKEGTIPPDPFGGTTDKVKMNPPRNSPDLIRPAGPIDPGISTIALRNHQGEPIALLSNYSLHYVGGTGAAQVSADYFGEFARNVTQRLNGGGDFVAILSNGTSGNINNINFQAEREERQPFEQIRKVADDVAAKAQASYEAMEFHREVEVDMVERLLTLDRRKPSEEEVAAARKRLVELDPKEDVRPHTYAQRTIDMHEGPATVEIKLQALRIGPIGVAAIPFETFVETGLELKEKSPFETTFTIELANGAEGYLPTPEHHELGGYETWLGTNRVVPDSSVKITASLLEMFGELDAEPAP